MEDFWETFCVFSRQARWYDASMIPASRQACFLLALICTPLFAAANSVVSVPANIQHFGPLLVVATHEDSPNPETYRSDLFSDKAEERMRLLRAIGIESIPELHEIWSAFLHDHAGEDQNKVIAQFISGGMSEENFGELGSKQVILQAGFDESSDHPFELRAVFDLKNGHWRHVSTVACRCLMYDSGEPFNPHPGSPMPRQEWVVTLHQRSEDDHLEYHAKEIRFRLHGDRLWPLINFESRSTICPQGSSYGPNCSVVKTDLEPAKLIGENNELIPGFVLISWSGKPPQKDMAAMILYNHVCKPYTWDEISFSYVPSQLKLKTCVPPPPVPKKPAAIPRQVQPTTGPTRQP
jgi:hypothetical protein